MRVLFKNSGLEVKVEQFKDGIFIETEDDERVLELLGSRLPISVYMGEFGVVDSFGGEEVYLDDTPTNLSICPSCLDEIVDKDSPSYLNHTKTCELCGVKNITTSRLEQIGLTLKSSGATEFFEAFAKAFIENGSATFLSHFGFITIYKEPCSDMEYALAFSVEDLRDSFSMSEDELLLLNSIERPRVPLITKPSSPLKSFGFNTLNASVTSCAMSYLVLFFLKKEGVNIVYARKGEYAGVKAFFKNTTSEDMPLVASANSKHRFLISGERGLLPLIVQNSDLSDKMSIFEPYAAIVNKGFIKANRLSELELAPVEAVTVDTDSSLKISHTSVLRIKKCEAYARYVNIFESEKAFISLYLSLEDDGSGLGIFREGRYKEAFSFASVPFCVDTILEGLIASNRVPEKLIQNYKDRFDKEYEKLSSMLNEKEHYSSKIGDIFTILSLFIEPSSDIKSSYAKLYNSSLLEELDGGVKIDMKLLKINEKYIFDWQKSLSSILSFKLAGVSTSILAYSLFESFSDFINENIIELKKQSGIDRVYLGGSFLGNVIFTKRVLKHSSNIYTPLISRRATLGGISVAIGGVNI